eukprot:scaffold122219_cov19-Prasinocladus_malaysianus.AAC.1
MGQDTVFTDEAAFWSSFEDQATFGHQKDYTVFTDEAASCPRAYRNLQVLDENPLQSQAVLLLEHRPRWT